MFNADRLPIPLTVGLVHGDVAGRINVSQPRHDAVSTRHKGPVDDNLVAGEQGQRGAGSTVCQGETAEGHVVSRGVLAACDDPLAPQLHHEVDGHLDVHTHRDVVDEQRQIGGLVQSAEVVLDLGRPGDGVERRGGDNGVHPNLLGLTDVTDDAQGLCVNDASQQRNPTVDDPLGLGQDTSTHLVVEEGHLGRGTEDEQTVHPLPDEAVDELFVGGDVQVTVGS